MLYRIIASGLVVVALFGVAYLMEPQSNVPAAAPTSGTDDASMKSLRIE